MIGAVQAEAVGAFEMTEFGAGDTVVLRVAGEVDLFTSGALGRCCAGILENHPRAFVIDLSGVTFLGAAGITVLVTAHERSARVGTVFTVVGNSRSVLRSLQVVGLDEMLSPRAAVHEALPPDTVATFVPAARRVLTAPPSQHE